MSHTNERNKKQWGLFVLDIVMVVLLLLNLNLIIFDWLFASEFIRSVLKNYLPDFEQWYAVHIHRDFLRIDLIFVAIFLAEFFFHWIEDVYHKRHSKWYFYPFIYWYDLLGCIPVGSLRFLRLLRFITIIHRLHRMQIINIANMPLFDSFTKLINIVIEEITDRVVIRILRNVRNEIKHGTPVIHEITEQLIKPRQQQVIEWLSFKIRHVARRNEELYRDEIKKYVDKRISEAVQQNSEIKDLRLIPFVGKQIEQRIERATADIVFSVINGALADLGSPDNKVLVEDITNVLFEEDELTKEANRDINRMITDLIVQSLDVIIAKVSIKEWKYDDITKSETLLKEKIKENLNRTH